MSDTESVRSITSLQHPLVKHLVKLRQNRSYRYDHRTVVVEGIKPIAELAANYKPRVVLTYDMGLVPKQWVDANVITVTEPVMQKVSGMIHPEGILAEIEMPTQSSLKGLKFIVAFDGIADPGNIGSLLRTALALGWDGVFLLDNCCDPYNEKVLRACRGANFRLPLREGSWNELQGLVEESQLTPLVADIKGKPVNEVSSEKILLILCNESHGPSEEALKLCKQVTVPMTSKMESLNVAAAGAILMYTLKG